MASSDPTSDFTTFQDGVFAALMSTVKSANGLASYDLDFERSSDPTFAKALDATNARILRLTRSLLNSAVAGTDLLAPRLKDADEVEEQWPQVVEVADYLLERADTCLDEYTGAIKQKNPSPLPNARLTTAKTPLSKTAQRGKQFSANSWASRNLIKPQLSFSVKPDPLDTSPFRPLLTSKPHAVVPLEDSFEMTETEDGSGRMLYQHPYHAEIDAARYPEGMFVVKEPVMYSPFEETEGVWVDTVEGLRSMLEELKRAEEIAVDLEHHDTRSYIGFVCLMQISTRDKDWIVDTLKLRTELQVLNEVFADPKIIKVLHGAYMDIIWLQRDFGLYMVSLFDTYFASKTLGFPSHGLAYLLKKYISFDADKQYQTADWRLRPLPKEMLDYARSDTHFLLHIFDHLRNALNSIPNPPPGSPESKLAYVLGSSRETASRLYTREPYDPVNGTGSNGWANILSRGSELNPEQTAVFRALHQWRDQTAREEDEGLHYTLPKHQLFTLARTLPDGAANVLRQVGQPGDILKRRVDEVVKVIKAALEQPEVIAWRAALQKAALQPALAVESLQSRNELFGAPADDIRVEHSTFWGNAEPERRAYTTPVEEEAAPSLAVPLPQLTAEVFLAPGTVQPTEEKPAETAPVDPGARAEHEYIRPENRPSRKEMQEDVMVIRQVGGGRKRKSNAMDQDDDSTATPAAATAIDADGERISKREQKRAKKAALAAAAEAAKEDGEEKKDVFTPFDYATAPSVLNAKKLEQEKAKKEKREKRDAKRREKGEVKKERYGTVGGGGGAPEEEGFGGSASRDVEGGGRKGKAFDPFSGLGDTAKGMGRSQRGEGGGRSKVFK